MKLLELLLGLFEWIGLFSPAKRESKAEKITQIRTYSKVVYLSRIIFEMTVLFAAYGFALVWFINSAFHGALFIWIICALTWFLLFGLSQVYLWASIRMLSDEKYLYHRHCIWIIHIICFVLLASSAIYFYINE